METAIVINALSLAIKYGVPAVMEGINALGKETITLEDIEALETAIKPPEEYK